MEATMSDEATPVRWSRPTKNRHGQTTYVSKCGRFTITKFEYILPRSISYVLEGFGRRRESDILADAKWIAESMVKR